MLSLHLDKIITVCYKKTLKSHLQLVQNARLNTSFLKSSYWLSVTCCIHFKILFLTYKCLLQVIYQISYNAVLMALIQKLLAIKDPQFSQF